MTTSAKPGTADDPAVQSEGAETRSLIIDATIRIMREHGYAAVSSRRIAADAGLKSKLVHYYFRTMDDLFLAVYKRIEDEHFARLTRVLTARQPLRALWRLNLDSTNTSMVLELTALANHRKGLRTEIARASERFRGLQAAIYERAVSGMRSDAAAPPPIVVSLLSLALSRLLAMDSVLGVSAGHEEALAWIERFLDSIEGPPGHADVPIDRRPAGRH